MALLKWLYLDCYTYNGLIYNCFAYNDNGQANYFNSCNLLRFLNKNAVNEL